MNTATKITKKQQRQLVSKEGWTLTNHGMMIDKVSVSSKAVAKNYEGCALNGLNTKAHGFYFIETELSYVFKSGNDYYQLAK